MKIPASLSPEAKSLIMGLLQRNPEHRLGSGKSGAEEIKSHDFFKKIDWNQALNKYSSFLVEPLIVSLLLSLTGMGRSLDVFVLEFVGFSIAFRKLPTPPSDITMHKDVMKKVERVFENSSNEKQKINGWSFANREDLNPEMS